MTIRLQYPNDHKLFNFYNTIDIIPLSTCLKFVIYSIEYYDKTKPLFQYHKNIISPRDRHHPRAVFYYIKHLGNCSPSGDLIGTSPELCRSFYRKAELSRYLKANIELIDQLSYDNTYNNNC